MNFDIKRVLKPELNVGLKDRKVRYGAGIGLLVLSIFFANIPLAIVGGILVGSAKMRWCPVYSGLGRSTVQPGEEGGSSSGCSGGHH